MINDKEKFKLPQQTYFKPMDPNLLAASLASLNQELTRLHEGFRGAVKEDPKWGWYKDCLEDFQAILTSIISPAYISIHPGVTKP